MVVIGILRHLNQKDKAWWYVDTHAGAGLYDLESDHARKNAEFESGIGRIWSRTDRPELVSALVDQVSALNPAGGMRLYPGSPWLASRLMRENDQLRLFELHSTDVQMLRQVFSESARHIKAEATDGFLGLKAVLPPQPRRGLVLIDPSYEIKDDYRRVLAAMKEALARFSTGTYAIWYPLLQRDQARQLAEKLKKLPVTAWLHVRMTVQGPSSTGFGMYGSGLFIINPPWQLADELNAALPWLVETLAQDAGAGHQIEQLTD